MANRFTRFLAASLLGATLFSAPAYTQSGGDPKTHKLYFTGIDTNRNKVEIDLADIRSKEFGIGNNAVLEAYDVNGTKVCTTAPMNIDDGRMTTYDLATTCPGVARGAIKSAVVTTDKQVAGQMTVTTSNNQIYSVPASAFPASKVSFTPIGVSDWYQNHVHVANVGTTPMQLALSTERINPSLTTAAAHQLFENIQPNGATTASLERRLGTPVTENSAVGTAQFNQGPFMNTTYNLVGHTEVEVMKTGGSFVLPHFDDRMAAQKHTFAHVYNLAPRGTVTSEPMFITGLTIFNHNPASTAAVFDGLDAAGKTICQGKDTIGAGQRYSKMSEEIFAAPCPVEQLASVEARTSLPTHGFQVHTRATTPLWTAHPTNTPLDVGTDLIDMRPRHFTADGAEHWTGYAIKNLENKQIMVGTTVYNKNGTPIARGTRYIGPQGKEAHTLEKWVQSTTDGQPIPEGALGTAAYVRFTTADSPMPGRIAGMFMKERDEAGRPANLDAGILANISDVAYNVNVSNYNPVTDTVDVQQQSAPLTISITAIANGQYNRLSGTTFDAKGDKKYVTLDANLGGTPTSRIHHGSSSTYTGAMAAEFPIPAGQDSAVYNSSIGVSTKDFQNAEIQHDFAGPQIKVVRARDYEMTKDQLTPAFTNNLTLEEISKLTAQYAWFEDGKQYPAEGPDGWKEFYRLGFDGIADGKNLEVAKMVFKDTANIIGVIYTDGKADSIQFRNNEEQYQRVMTLAGVDRSKPLN